jgi:hypothetical protein
MHTIISPTFLKQEAKKLQKTLGLPTRHEALDKICQVHGFVSWRHYLNVYKKLKKQLPKKPSKIEFELPFLEDSTLSFEEQFDILKLFQQTQDMQSTCQKWKLMQDEIRYAVFNEFLTEEGKYEISFRHPYYRAKTISVKDLEYELKGNLLCIDGEYDLILEFDEEVPILYHNLPHFENHMLSGSFGIRIDKDIQVLVPHLNIIQIMDGIVYAGTLKPTAKVIPAMPLEDFLHLV